MSEEKRFPVLFHAPTGYDGVVPPMFICLPLPAHDARLAWRGPPIALDATQSRVAPERGLPPDVQYLGKCVIEDVRTANGYFGFECDPVQFTQNPTEGKNYEPGWYLVKWVCGFWKYGPGFLVTRSPDSDWIGCASTELGIPNDSQRTSPHAFHVIYRMDNGRLDSIPFTDAPRPPANGYATEDDALRALLDTMPAWPETPELNIVRTFRSLPDLDPPHGFASFELPQSAADKLAFFSQFANIREAFYHAGGPIKIAFYDYRLSDNAAGMLPVTFALYKLDMPQLLLLPTTARLFDGSLINDEEAELWLELVFASRRPYDRAGGTLQFSFSQALSANTFPTEYAFTHSEKQFRLFGTLRGLRRKNPYVRVTVESGGENVMDFFIHFDAEAHVRRVVNVAPFYDYPGFGIDFWWLYDPDWTMLTGWRPSGQLVTSYYSASGALMHLSLTSNGENVPILYVDRPYPTRPDELPALPNPIAVDEFTSLTGDRRVYCPPEYAGEHVRLKISFTVGGEPLRVATRFVKEFDL